ncbi:MAG: HEPN domain-containing protein [Christensenellaceae bacterium]|jgi:HEPN domain-containing protein|nr:HEPN domain-containing protein [Christensenellaceae bacterium]
MCQQSIEKLVKGLYIVYIDDNIPMIHNITELLKRFENKLPFPVPQKTYSFFDNLTAYYLNTRYTKYKQKLSSLMNEDKAKSILAQIKEVYTWLLTLKP